MDKEENLQRRVALVAIPLSLSSLFYFFALSAKVPVRATLSVPNLEIIVEINPNKSPSRYPLLQDEMRLPIAASNCKKN